MLKILFKNKTDAKRQQLKILKKLQLQLFRMVYPIFDA